MTGTPRTNITRRIDLTTLRLFIAICEEGNLTRASQREAIAPSAVSKRMHDLEEVLEVALFERHPNGMALTPAGESLLHHARVTLLNVEKIARRTWPSMRAACAGMCGCWPICRRSSNSFPTICPAFFRSARARAARSAGAPQRRCRSRRRGGRRRNRHLLRPTLSTRGLERFSLSAGPPRHRGAVRSSACVGKRRFVRRHARLRPCRPVLRPARSICARNYTAQQIGKSIRLRVHVPGFDAVCRMVQAGMGIGLIPDRAFEVLSHGMNLTAVELSDDWADRELVLVARDPDGIVGDEPVDVRSSAIARNQISLMAAFVDRSSIRERVFIERILDSKALRSATTTIKDTSRRRQTWTDHYPEYEFVELGTLIAAPFAARCLPSSAPKSSRSSSRTAAIRLRKWRKLHQGTSLWWYLQSRNKKSICVDLKSPDGRRRRQSASPRKPISSSRICEPGRAREARPRLGRAHEAQSRS